MSISSLKAHEIAPCFYNLGGKLTPISIRDQMVRAQMLIEGALEQRLIGSEPYRPLLVVGAGAAGATAAMWASRKGVPTLLVERDPSAFNRQSGCRTRWVDPSQYDWPAGHWNTPDCPCVHVPTPLPWSANWAHSLASLWQIRLNSVPFPFFGVSYSTMVTSIHPIPGTGGRVLDGWRVSLTGFPLPLDFGVVMWTVGMGSERCDVGNYHGFPFWSSDPFDLPDCGVPASGPRIVISGSGDGSLQDFLRISTNKRSAKEIYNLCGLNAAQQALVQRTLYSAEDLAQRALHWGPNQRNIANKRNDHRVLNTLHDVHKSLVEGLVGPGISAGDKQDIIKSLNVLIRNPLPPIHLVHSCNHFSNSYGLNHFLTLFIGEYLKSERGLADIFIPRRNVASVTGVGGHICAGNWLSCHGEDHEVRLEEALDCQVEQQPPVLAEQISANVIIIRHGIDSSVLPPLPEIRLPRQSIPYHALA